MLNKALLFIALAVPLLAQENSLVFENIRQNIHSSDNSDFIFSASFYKIYPEQIKHNYHFFNRKEVFKNYKYYEHGKINSQIYDISFEKAYMADQNIYFDNLTFKSENRLYLIKNCISKNYSKTLQCEKAKYFIDNNLEATSRTLNIQI